MTNPGSTWYRSRDGTADFTLDLLITQSPIPCKFDSVFAMQLKDGIDLALRIIA